MNLANIGASTMHRTRCIVVLAEGEFKINGPPEMGKGPMSQGNNLGMRGEASLPQPTQAGRIETCTELIRQAMRCLENNDRECVMMLIEELVRNQCHDGRLIGKEVADKVRDLVHELWLVSGNEFRCRLLKMFKDLGISKGWVKIATRTTNQYLNKCLVKCGIDWESKATRNNVIEDIEDLLRKEFDWSEVRMCEEMWKFVGVDTETFRKYGVEPCAWLSGLELLSDLRRPYWFGMRVSDLSVEHLKYNIRLELGTTNTIDAILFPILLSTIKTPGLVIKWKRRAPAAKYVHKSINLLFYVDVSANDWPWPIELSADVLERILNSFTNEELAEFIGALLDGDGDVRYKGTVYVEFAACKACSKRFVLDVLKEVIARRFGIIGNIYQLDTIGASILEFGGEDAVKLLKLIRPFVHHPLRRLRIEVILALYDGRIDDKTFERLYEQTEYERGRDDIKRNRGLEALVRAAPQTHTHRA
jgi:hypothetical protein